MLSVSALSSGFTAYIGDGILILIFLFSAFMGYKKGFLGLVVGFLSGIVAIVATTLLCKPLVAVIGDSFGLRTTIENYVGGMFDFSNEIYTTPIKELTEEQIATAIEWLKLPSFLNDTVANLIQAKIADASVGEEVTAQMIIVGGISNVALIAIVWISLFIVFTIVFSLLKRFVKGFDKVPLIGTVDKLLGAALCLVITAFVVCGVMYLFILISGALPQVAVDYVNNSVLLKWVYDNNPLAWALSAILNK